MAKKSVKDNVIRLRVSSKDKTSISRAAKRAKIGMSEWLLSLAVKAASRSNAKKPSAAKKKPAKKAKAEEASA